MTSHFPTKMKPHVGILLVLGFAGFILFFQLGNVGIFEPHESARVETVERIADGGSTPLFPLALEERIAASLNESFGTSEVVLRLPSALFALLSVVLIYVVLLPFMGSTFAAIAGLVLCGSSLWLLHGRQLTSAMPAITAEIAAMGGGLIAVFFSSKRSRIAGILLASAGIALGSLSKGLLVGAAPVGFAAAFSAFSCGLFSKDKSVASRIVVIAAAAVGVLAVGVYAGVVLFSAGDLPQITGRETNAIISEHTFEFAFEQIVYGWYPLCVLSPAAVLPLFQRPTEEPEGRAFVRTFAVYALLFEYAAQVVALKVNGIRFASTALPMTILITLAAEDLVSTDAPKRLAVFISAALLAVLIRDFAQNNQTLFYAYGFDNLSIPKNDTRLVVIAGLSAIPTALLIVYAFLPGRLKKRTVSLLLTAAAPAAFAICVSFFLIPEVGVYLSSKQGLTMVEKYLTGNEPFGVLGKSGFTKDAVKLRSAGETAKWLDTPRRVFALFAPKELPAVDRALRDRTGRQVFVLEKAGDRFMLAVSKPTDKEKNVSPIKGVVQSAPFDGGLPGAEEVNFNDAVTLLGRRLESEGDAHRLQRGQDMIFTSYWRVDGRIPGDYKMFIHIDGPGGRLHGDHEMFQGNFPTSTWQKGDYVKETFRMKVPGYQGKGTYSVRMGLYNDKGRLKIKDNPKALDNSLLLGDTVID